MFLLLDARQNFNIDKRAWGSSTGRSKIEQKRNVFPVTQQTGHDWTTSSSNNNKRGLDLKLLARRAYQMALNQPLYNSKQNYWRRKLYDTVAWRKSPISSVPLRSYNAPAVAQKNNLLQNTGSRNVLPAGASLWNNVDEDVKFVEEKIQEYYDQRLNKDKNRWMFKPVEGSTKHLKEIFVGRCWDFVANKGKYLKNPSKVDCQKLWKAFFKAFAFKRPCDVTFGDYTAFFKLYDEEPLSDRVKVLFL